MNKCTICENLLQGKQTHYCGIQCKNKAHQSYNQQQDRGLQRKLQLLELSGGKCGHCGYDKNLAGLAFHHMDAKNKSFKLDMRSLSNRTFQKVLEEFKKCELICHNCHAEVHNPHLDLGSLL